VCLRSIQVSTVESYNNSRLLGLGDQLVWFYFLDEALADCPLLAAVFASLEWAAKLGPAPVAFLISPDCDFGGFAALAISVSISSVQKNRLRAL